MIVIRVQEALTLREKIGGLLLARKPYPLLIKTRWGIHTFFMDHIIDVIVLNKENRVVKLKENLAPNRMFMWNPRYNKIIELPAGTIRNKNIHVDSFVDPQIHPE